MLGEKLSRAYLTLPLPTSHFPPPTLIPALEPFSPSVSFGNIVTWLNSYMVKWLTIATILTIATMYIAL